MIRYINDPENFEKALCKILPIEAFAFVSYLKEAIKTGKEINYNDEAIRYVLSDAGIDENKALKLFFNGNVIREIDLSVINISQSNSVPREFYLNKSNEEYQIIIF